MNGREQHAQREARRLVRELRALAQDDAPPDLALPVLGEVGLIDHAFRIDSPIGPMFVAYNPAGISAVYPADNAEEFADYFQQRFNRHVRLLDHADPKIVRAVTARLQGKRVPLRFDLRGLSDFGQAVLRKTAEIPRGQVRPYSWIAREIGRPGAVRAVGTALNHNPAPLLIPCHRIVRSDGAIGEYAWGEEAKWALLTDEGLEPDRYTALGERGIRYFGSDTTKIYCFPTCRYNRRVTSQHLMTFASAAAAREAGYRACKVCRP